MLVHGLWFALGLLLLIKGADWLVAGASALAKTYGVTDLAIGLTIVAFGTSAPELVVNGFASWQGHHDIVVGNVVGSNNFNLFIILGVVGLLAPLRVHSSTVWREIPVSLVCAVIVLLLCNNVLLTGGHVLSRWDAVILLVMFALFLFYVYTQLDSGDPMKEQIVQHKPGRAWVLIVLGLAGLILGGRLMVNSAVQIATSLGISEKITGLTIVAAGTSLPELATSLVAVYRRNHDIAVGNIVGSNIFNLLLILSVSALIYPIRYNPAFNTDFLVFAGGTTLLFIAMFTGGSRKLDRWEAAILLVGYIAYSSYLISQEV
ncbi:MAG: calcium/sodium antiporter [Saprospiraceae bacterium]|nr:calcium/sodium antiporter [Saprospiraceae bacterium]